MDDSPRVPLKETVINTTGSSAQTGSYQSLPSSMDTCTLSTDYIDGFGSGPEDEPEKWGRLFPVGSSFESFDLSKEDYSFGRGENCDYQFNTPLMKKHPCFQAYSKVHFKLTREKTSTGVHIFLTDASSNGTFINGEKVGKNCKQVIHNNDEIALAMKKHKAFVYMDLHSKEDESIPQELKDKYTLSKILGRGACGEVRLAFEKGTCNKFAVKIIQKKNFSIGGKTPMSSSDQVMNEVKILKAMKHPCIIGIEDVVNTAETLFIVLELVEGGELFDRVVSIEHFDEPTAKLLFYLMVSGVKYLHDQGITHRDLKPENILLMDENNETLIKVTDFGLSKFVDTNTMMKTFCGTPNYLAPEILLTKGAASYTKAIDCWSLGVILFICLVGYPPFSEDRKDMEMHKQILGAHYTMPDEYWEDVSKDGQDMVRKLLVADPKKRMSLDDAMNHVWFKDEEMKKKAQKLMYPVSDGMVPPQNMPKKRKPEGETSPVKKVKAN